LGALEHIDHMEQGFQVVYFYLKYPPSPAFPGGAG